MAVTRGYAQSADDTFAALAALGPLLLAGQPDEPPPAMPGDSTGTTLRAVPGATGRRAEGHSGRRPGHGDGPRPRPQGVGLRDPGRVRAAHQRAARHPALGEPDPAPGPGRLLPRPAQ